MYYCDSCGSDLIEECLVGTIGTAEERAAARPCLTCLYCGWHRPGTHVRGNN